MLMTTEPGQVDINWFWSTRNHIIDYSNTDCTTEAIKINPEYRQICCRNEHSLYLEAHFIRDHHCPSCYHLLVKSASHQAKVVWMNRLQKGVKEMASKYCHGYTTFNKTYSVLLVYLHISIDSQMQETVVRYHVNLPIRCCVKTVFKMKFWIWLLNNCKISVRSAFIIFMEMEHSNNFYLLLMKV